MRLTHIHIRNFRGLRDVRLDSLPPRVFLTGKTGSGKTTIQQAVQVVLWGRIFDHQGKRVEVGDLVGSHGKEAVIELGMDVNGQSMRAEWSAKKQTSLRVTREGRPALEGNPRQVRADLWAELDAVAEQAECGGNPRAYLTCQDLGALLAGLGGAEVSQDKLTIELGPHAAWFWAYCNEHGLDWNTREGLTQVGKAVYKSRSTLNTDMAACDREIKALGDAALPRDADGKPVETTQAPHVSRRLDELAAARDELNQELGAVGQRRPAAMIASDLEQARAEAGQAETGMDTAAVTEREAASVVKDLNGQIQTARRDESDLRGRLAVAQGEQDRAQRALDETDKAEACPVCARKMTDAIRKQVLGPLQERLSEAQAEVRKLEADAAQYEKAIDKARAHLDEANGTRQAAQDALGEATTVARQTQARVDQLEAEAPAGDRTADEIQTEIAATQGRILKGKAMLQGLQDVINRRGYQQQLADMQAEHEHLDWAVEAFEKGAVQQVLGADGRTAFIERCCAALVRYGYQMEIAVGGKDVTALMGRISKRAIPVSQVSEGEFILAQLAVATGFCGDGGLVMVDGLDKLDGDHKAWVVEALAASKAGTMWLAGAYGLPGDPDLARMQEALGEVAVVWVEDGGAAVQVGRGGV